MIMLFMEINYIMKLKLIYTDICNKTTSVGISSCNGRKDEQHISKKLSEPLSIFHTILTGSSIFI